MPLFKRRSGFFGTRLQEMTTPGPSPSSAEVPVERPVPVVTASSKKLAIVPRCPSVGGPAGNLRSSCLSMPSAGESSSSVGELRGYRLIKCEEYIQSLSETGKCPTCRSPLTLREELATRRGLVSKLMTSCTNTACDYEIVMSDPRSEGAKSLNARSVLGMRAIGRGRSSLESFCGLMDMLPPLATAAFSRHNEAHAKAADQSAIRSMLCASAYLHELRPADPSDVIDVLVTCDGTWCKRGFTATHGVVVVISWESGQVLDYEIMTKRCTVCSVKAVQLGEKSAEYEAWLEEHKAVCEVNHDGSSPAMELEGAKKIWARSVETRALRYTEVCWSNTRSSGFITYFTTSR